MFGLAKLLKEHRCGASSCFISLSDGACIGWCKTQEFSITINLRGTWKRGMFLMQSYLAKTSLYDGNSWGLERASEWTFSSPGMWSPWQSRGKRELVWKRNVTKIVPDFWLGHCVSEMCDTSKRGQRYCQLSSWGYSHLEWGIVLELFSLSFWGLQSRHGWWWRWIQGY